MTKIISCLIFHVFFFISLTSAHFLCHVVSKGEKEPSSCPCEVIYVMDMSALFDVIKKSPSVHFVNGS